MTQEQYYQYQQSYRNQQVYRAYIQAVGVDDSEHHRKEYPKTQTDMRDALADEKIGNINLQDSFSVSGNAMEIAVGRSVTMSLGDNMLSGNGMSQDSIITVHNGGELVINGSNGGIAAGNESSSNCAIKLTKAGDSDEKTAKLTINGGTYTAKYSALAGNGSRKNTSLTINDGTFTGQEENDSAALFHPQEGDVTIRNGRFEAATSIWIKSGRITVNGGEFIGNGLSAEYIYSGNGFNSTGDGFVVDNCAYPGGIPVIEINGGYFYSENANPIASYSFNGKEALSGFVKGGYFNKMIDDSLVAEGYQQVETGSENWKYKVIPLQ